MNLRRLLSVCSVCSVGLLAGGCMSSAQYKKIPTIELEGWKHVDNLGPWQSSIAVDRVSKNPDGTFTALNYEGTASFMGYGIRDEIKAIKITPPTAKTKPSPAPADKP